MQLPYSRRRLATTSERVYAFWTLGGDNDCPNAKIEIKTSAKILNGTRKFAVYELDQFGGKETYLGDCESEEGYGQTVSCSQQIVCFENEEIYEIGSYYDESLEEWTYGYHYDTRQIYAGDTFGIEVSRELYDIEWSRAALRSSCGSNIDLDVILICNNDLSDSGSGSNAAASIVLFVICLLYMLPTFAWAVAYFFAKYGTLASLNRRKPAPFIQSLKDIWKGSGLIQRAAMVFEAADLILDLRTSTNIMADAPSKPNSQLWRAMGGINIFSFILSAIFFIWKFNILRKFMPCIRKWKEDKKRDEEDMRMIDSRIDHGELKPSIGKIKKTNIWNQYKKSNRKINKYLAHLVMFTLFTAALEDSIQCMVQFRLQWDLLLYSENGLELYYNGNGWYWLQVIKGLFGMSYKLAAALVMTFGCHKESLEVDLKPEGVDEDDSDYGPITFQNVFYGKKGLMPGGAVDKETVLTADIVSAAMNIWQKGNNGPQDPLMDEGTPGSGGSGTGDNGLPPGWKQRRTQDGKEYYQNDITKQTQWERPQANKPLESDDETVPEMEPTIIYLPDPEPDEFTVKYRKTQNFIMEEVDDNEAKDGMNGQGVDRKENKDDDDDDAKQTQILEELVDEVSGNGRGDGQDDDDKENEEPVDNPEDPDKDDEKDNGGANEDNNEVADGNDDDGSGVVDGDGDNDDEEKKNVEESDDISTEESDGDDEDEMEFFEQVVEYGDFENAKDQLKDDYDKYEEEWKKNVLEFVQEKAKYLKNLTLKSVAKDYVLSMFNDKNGYKRSMEMLQALNQSKDFHKIEKVENIQRNDNQAP